MVQTYVVRLIRAANRWVVYGDRKKVSAALKKVNTAPDEASAAAALEEFVGSELGEKCPGPLKSGRTRGSGSCRFYSFLRQRGKSSTRRTLSRRLTMSCAKPPATECNLPTTNPR